jgi:ubiquinone/menaquinone biosynthesis C-methylase UbiE
MFRPAIDEERRRWQDPEAILASIGLKPGQTFIDVGCGGGFFTLPAARMVGDKGKVYGVDTSDRAIASLKALAEREGLKNLHPIAGKGEETVVCEGCADIVFFGIALHDFQDAARVAANARKMVKPAGRLVNLDWKKDAKSPGPPVHIRFSEAKASRLIEAAGFTIETVRDSGPYHYIIIARPRR